ncbi:MAG: DNA repair protein [Sphingobacteriales bacterium]|nr:MAG: DNA repair protein [Sphingobacteriales bacterium]
MADRRNTNQHTIMQATTSYAVSEIRVVYERPSMKDRPQITTSSEAHDMLLTGFDNDTVGLQEQYVVLMMNRGNKVLGLYRASTGGITGTVADIRIILAVALKIGATGIIAGHNHPSANLRPSKADDDLTRKMKDAAQLMDIRVYDHLILDGEGGFFSYADEGLL